MHLISRIHSTDSVRIVFYPGTLPAFVTNTFHTRCLSYQFLVWLFHLNELRCLVLFWLYLLVYFDLGAWYFACCQYIMKQMNRFHYYIKYLLQNESMSIVGIYYMLWLYLRIDTFMMWPTILSNSFMSSWLLA